MVQLCTEYEVPGFILFRDIERVPNANIAKKVMCRGVYSI